MALNLWRLSVLSIVPRRCKSIVIALLGYRWKIRWWGWFHVSRVGMRTTGQEKRQQQRCQSKPFLHVISSIFDCFVPLRASATLGVSNP
jgi:hypothetical protein